jgi:hypothetical protein
MILMTLFSDNDDFVRETKIVPREKRYSESETSSMESDNTSNAGGNHLGKRRQNAKLRIFLLEIQG